MGIFNIGPTEILVVMIVVLLIFGPDQLSEIAKKLGQAQRTMNKTYETFNEQMLSTLQGPEPGKPAASSPTPALPAPTDGQYPASNPAPPAAAADSPYPAATPAPPAPAIDSQNPAVTEPTPDPTSNPPTL